MNLYKMTIGTSTFYTINCFFAIETFGFFQYFFEFIVNFRFFLLIFNKFLKIYHVKTFFAVKQKTEIFS